MRDAARPKSVHHDHLQDHLHGPETTLTGRLDMIIGVLILANCAAMMVQLEYVGYKSEITLGEKEDNGSW
eukprot:CAMPEP_0169398510 /NCGR_PEP_ID=MMETSP1017-20121227/52686_1 /TAXON_ID=342587 /ORGANISM="Karlodinium micrum, Strain CCMP2283" /LENGTH=69 /DNA_ID=CAMNT_0009503513 /DNA_START=42 /DNA_END=248 /DNA_ORIENTATION=+